MTAWLARVLRHERLENRFDPTTDSSTLGWINDTWHLRSVTIAHWQVVASPHGTTQEHTRHTWSARYGQAKL